MLRTRFRPVGLLLAFSACLAASEIQRQNRRPSGAPIGPGAQSPPSTASAWSRGPLRRSTAASSWTVPNPRHAARRHRGRLQHPHPAARSGGQRATRNRAAGGFRAGGGPPSKSPPRPGLQRGRDSERAVRPPNEPFAMDLLRYVPGVAFNQSGAAGGVTSLFLRGGNAIEPGANRRRAGDRVRWRSFDFAHIPCEAVDHIDVDPRRAIRRSTAPTPTRA